uniref:Uncharacterized protein n=1 Tax=Pipistrellus kuhlii TaxID=59472 RepID=A0A7J7VVA5_PIPKU|nr:hypothetical protein mPipKuh1_008279 [Pipistrellus kuhlii]
MAQCSRPRELTTDTWKVLMALERKNMFNIQHERDGTWNSCLALSSINDLISHVDAMFTEYLSASKLRNLLCQMMAQWQSENALACWNRLSQDKFNLIGSKTSHWIKREIITKREGFGKSGLEMKA